MNTLPEQEITRPIQPVVPVKAFLNQPPRPMLARDADSMYWMSRYVERAEHVARLLLVNTNLLMDVGDLAPRMQSRLWQNILTILRLADLPDIDDASEPPADSRGVDAPAPDSHSPNSHDKVSERPNPTPSSNGGPPRPPSAPVGVLVQKSLTFDGDNPNSLLSCVTRARENARGIRETISAEMWEALNTLYWSVCGDDAPARFEDSPDDFYRSIMTGSMLFQGLTDGTLAHDQRWLFTQLAKYFERVDITCRVIETKYHILQSDESMTESAIRNIHWMAVLRSCCSIEAYRRNHLGDMDPLKVAGFLLLEKNFPRSVRFAVCGAYHAISQIRAGINPNGLDAAERVLGRLDAQLEYAELSEVLVEGLPAYLEKIQTAIADAALAVQKAYFLH